MIGVFLASWVLFPALMVVLSAGAGLAVRRIAGREAVCGLLVVPIGLATLVVLCGALCYAAPLAPLAGPACALVGVGGLVLERRAVMRFVRRRGGAKVDLWALAAALGAAAVIAAPIVLSGKPGFTGYAHIVDTSYEFDLAAHFPHSGRSIPPGTLSAYRVVLAKYLASGYPGGGPWTLGALSNLTPIDLSWLYQPFLAFLTAMSALSLYSLLGSVIQVRWLRALGAFIAAQPNILVAYVEGAGIKELTTVCFLLLSAATLARALPRFAPGRALLVPSLALAATVAAFSLTTLPWIATLGVGVGLTVVLLQRARVRALFACAQITALTFVLSLPTLAAAVKLLPAVKGQGPVDLGNLAEPIPAITSAGVWIAGDVRFPRYAHHVPSEALAVVVIVLAACGLIFAARRRAWSVFWLGIAGAVSLYYVAHRYGPWIQFKSYTISSPEALLLAFAGAGALIRISGRTLVGALPALAVAAGVLAGNALLYHDAVLAPYARLHNLESIGTRFAHQGPTLTPDFDEYAEYYLRDDEQTSMVNGPSLGLRVGVDRAAEPGGLFQYDLNEFTLDWVESFRTIVMRRSPLASRPPSNYRLAYLSRYYEVWQRVRPANTITAHVIPTAGEHGGAACAQVAAAARRAGPSARIVYTRQPYYIQVDASNTVISGAFQNAGGPILARGAGRATRDQPIPRAGLYEFFIGGSFGRPVSVSVDGERVGAASYEPSYPNQSVLIGSRWLSHAVHRVTMARGGVSLHPGNGDGVDGFSRTIGPLVMIPASESPPPLRYGDPQRFSKVCRSLGLRWIEVVRGP